MPKRRRLAAFSTTLKVHRHAPSNLSLPARTCWATLETSDRLCLLSKLSECQLDRYFNRFKLDLQLIMLWLDLAAWFCLLLYYYITSVWGRKKDMCKYSATAGKGEIQYHYHYIIGWLKWEIQRCCCSAGWLPVSGLWSSRLLRLLKLWGNIRSLQLNLWIPSWMGGITW